jgi:hypothetical protein
VLSLDGGDLQELAIVRVDIDGEEGLYGFASARARTTPKTRHAPAPDSSGE